MSKNKKLESYFTNEFSALDASKLIENLLQETVKISTANAMHKIYRLLIIENARSHNISKEKITISRETSPTVSRKQEILHKRMIKVADTLSKEDEQRKIKEAKELTKKLHQEQVERIRRQQKQRLD